MSIKMIALDLDGTTLSSDGTISDKNRRAIERAAEAGVQVVISTGRAESALPKDVLEIPAIRYVISSNGSRITDTATGECIYGEFLSTRALHRSIEIAKEYDITIEAFYDGIALIDRRLYEDIEANGCGYRNREYVLRTRIPVDNIYERMLENEDRIENINFFFPTPDILEDYRAVIEAIPEAMITSSFPVNLEVGGPHTSKKQAIVHLMEQLGIVREELMCVGDAPNDLEMIRYAGIGVAMGNAWGNIKEEADYVTESNDNDGVAAAIERFVLI